MLTRKLYWIQADYGFCIVKKLRRFLYPSAFMNLFNPNGLLIRFALGSLFFRHYVQTMRIVIACCTLCRRFSICMSNHFSNQSRTYIFIKYDLTKFQMLFCFRYFLLLLYFYYFILFNVRKKLATYIHVVLKTLLDVQCFR